jgi:hypothetical protein
MLIIKKLILCESLCFLSVSAAFRFFLRRDAEFRGEFRKEKIFLLLNRME